MGFKCPVCLKDFKKDKKKWKDHIQKEHYGAGEDAVNFVQNLCEDSNKGSEKGINNEKS